MDKSGVIIVDKPQGVTSHDVVAACRGLLHTSKVGHAGTLDPMATGVLVIGFGSATRLLNSIVGTDKTYITTIELGAQTTTDDADGEFIELNSDEQQEVENRLAALRDDDIYAQVKKLTGQIEQVPSTYSAKKINGKRAYDLARQGKDVALEPNSITIHDFMVTDIRRANGRVQVDAQVTCSAGTYIRALGRDLGSALGVGGYLTMLRRTRVGTFAASDERAVKFSAKEREFTDKEGHKQKRLKAYAPCDVRDDEQLTQRIISPAEAAQTTMPIIELTGRQAIDISFGRLLALTIDQQCAALYNGYLMALLEPWKKNQAKPTTVFITPQDLAELAEAQPTK